MTEAIRSSPVIEWGAASSPYPGYQVSGDLHVVKPHPDGVLVAVIDGLGHGGGAEAAARAAARVLEVHAGEHVRSLMKRCHDALKRTRGVAMSLADFASGGTMTWIGVGNVEGILLRAGTNGLPERQGLVQRGGVVGYQLPPLREGEIPVEPGDTLVLATDGIKTGFARDVRRGATPQSAADHLLREYGKDTDDSLVLVARYSGDAP